MATLERSDWLVVALLVMPFVNCSYGAEILIQAAATATLHKSAWRSPHHMQGGNQIIHKKDFLSKSDLEW